MNVIHRSIMIPIEQLKPHPDNPRKDVGDVAELAWDLGEMYAAVKECIGE